MNDMLFKKAMSFEHPTLRNAAFETSHANSTLEQQACLAGCYEAILTVRQPRPGPSGGAGLTKPDWPDR
jgi:hypothetical protein